MRRLVVLRHAPTRKGRPATSTASHLSGDGVRQARALGEHLPTFARVVVGPQPRHLETALALGCAVDEQVDWPSGYVEGVVGHHDQWSWSEPFVRYARLHEQHRSLRTVVDTHLAHWRRTLDRVDDGSAALVVSSGGTVEPVLAAAVPDADHAAWGGALHQLEGAELVWDGDRFEVARILRGPRSSP